MTEMVRGLILINMDLRETGFRNGGLIEMVQDVLLTCN
jgi:hypothetical protein